MGVNECGNGVYYAPKMTAKYVFADEHVHDVQDASAFRNCADNWKARYDVEWDVWHVTTPSGLSRTYARIKGSE